MKQFVSRWEIAEVRQGNSIGTLITYSGKLEPRFFVPPLLGPALICSVVRKIVIAVIREVEK